MFPARRWIPVGLALASITVVSLVAQGWSAPAPPAPPDPPDPAVAPAPPLPPEVHIWTNDDPGDADDLAVAYLAEGQALSMLDEDDDGPGGASAMAMGGYGGGELAKTLKLTDDQKNKIDALRDKQRRAAIQARADLELAQLDMAKLMRADQPDRAAIDTQIDKVEGQRAAMRKARIRTMLDMRDVLTPQQRQILKDEREKRRDEMREHFRGDMGRHREVIRVRNRPLDTQ